MRWVFVVVAGVAASGLLSLWFMFRPPRSQRELDAEIKRERRRQIERARLEKWERLDAARRDALRRRKDLNDRFRRDDPDKEP
jgi:hypothetical protein